MDGKRVQLDIAKNGCGMMLITVFVKDVNY